MDETNETVTVIGPDGEEMLVDKSVYDSNPDDYTIFGGEAKIVDEPTVFKTPFVVAKREDGKFIVVDQDGKPVTGVEGIDENGYESEAEAWAPVMGSAGK